MPQITVAGSALAPCAVHELGRRNPSVDIALVTPRAEHVYLHGLTDPQWEPKQA